jgi:thymidylate synthase
MNRLPPCKERYRRGIAVPSSDSCCGWPDRRQLASLQRHVADGLGVPVGRMLMIIKSAHVYETELSYIEGVLAGDAAGRSEH